MKCSKLVQITALFSILLVNGTSAQTGVRQINLFEQPEIESKVITSISSNDPILENSERVMDASKADIGWRFVNTNSPRVVYVPDAKIGKDLLPVDDAKLYLKPTNISPVVTTYSYGDKVEVIDSGPWWKLSISKDLPAYYVDESVAVASSAKKKMLSDQNTEKSTTFKSVFLEPVDRTPTKAEPLPVIDSNPGAKKTEKPTEPDSMNGISQSFTGKFVQVNKKMGLFSQNYSFSLQDDKERRIAWVDVSEVVVPGSLDVYVGKNVIIYGSKIYNKDTKEWRIKAKNMRLQ